MANGSNSSALVVPARPGGAAGVEEVDIHDIRPPVEIAAGWGWIGWWALALALALLGWWAWRKWRRRAASGGVASVVIPPHYRARQRLREARGLMEQPEPFCVQVSAAVRDYLEERFALHAPDRTTEEFLTELQGGTVLHAAQQSLLGEFLRRCDLVKFARYAPSEPELEDLLGAATRLVDETAPPEVVVAGSEGRVRSGA